MRRRRISYSLDELPSGKSILTSQDPKKSILRFCYSLYLRLVTRIRKNKTIHYFLMGYHPCQDSDYWGEYWDWTTLTLIKAMKLHLQPCDRFLDMGTGSVGVLAIYAGLRLRCASIVAVDCIPDLLIAARNNAQNARISIQFFCSDLFSGIDGKYNVIAFNAPYLDQTKGRWLGLMDNPVGVKRFSGGIAGKETISRFLNQAPSYLSPGGKILIGVNHFHITIQTMNELISSSRFFVFERITRWWLPGTVYVLFVQNKESRVDDE